MYYLRFRYFNDGVMFTPPPPSVTSLCPRPYAGLSHFALPPSPSSRDVIYEWPLSGSVCSIMHSSEHLGSNPARDKNIHAIFGSIYTPRCIFLSIVFRLFCKALMRWVRYTLQACYGLINVTSHNTIELNSAFQQSLALPWKPACFRNS